jgi:hypothetical protein
LLSMGSAWTSCRNCQVEAVFQQIDEELSL